MASSPSYDLPMVAAESNIGSTESKGTSATRACVGKIGCLISVREAILRWTLTAHADRCHGTHHGMSCPAKTVFFKRYLRSWVAPAARESSLT
jgi:hypothetical protein